MRHLKLLGLVLASAFVVSAMLSTAAFALPEVLNAAHATTTFSYKGTSGKGKFEELGGLIPISCESATYEGASGGTLGPLHIMFASCTCTGLGEASGVILVLGEYHIVYLKLSPLTAGLLLLINEVHLECALGVLVQVKGSVLGEITPINTLAKEFTFTLTQSKGDPSTTKYFDDNGVEQSALLLVSKNGGTFKDAADGSENNKLKVTTPTEIELMA